MRRDWELVLALALGDGLSVKDVDGEVWPMLRGELNVRGEVRCRRGRRPSPSLFELLVLVLVVLEVEFQDGDDRGRGGRRCRCPCGLRSRCRHPYQIRRFLYHWRWVGGRRHYSSMKLTRTMI